MTVRTFTINVTAPPTGVPSYATGLADFEVRHLTGTYAPANGIVTLQAAQPPEWQPLDAPTGLKGVINDWSGGSQDVANRRLLFSGGGHSVSLNNGVMVYDFGESGGRPIGWSIAPISQATVAQAQASAGTTTVISTGYGNMPCSAHTYDWQRYAPTSRRFYRISGGDINNRQLPQSLWYYQFPSGPWVDVGAANGNNNILSILAASGGPQGATAIVSPDETQYLLITTVSNTYFINTSTAALTLATISGSPGWNGSSEFQPVLVEDTGASRASGSPNVKRYLAIADNLTGTRVFRVVTVDWSAKSVTYSTFTPSDPTKFGRGGSFIFDSVLDCFWWFGGRPNVREGNNLVTRMDADTFAVTQHTLSQSLPVFSTLHSGNYNRHLWLEAQRLVCTVTSPTHAASIFKLPSI